MVKLQAIERGSVFLAKLDPTTGSEIQKTRPCLIISPPEMLCLKTVLVAPMTTKSHAAPFRIPVTFQDRTGLILLDQIRTLDRRRLLSMQGGIDEQTLAQVLKVLGAMFQK